MDSIEQAFDFADDGSIQSQPQPYDPDDQGITGSETQDAGSVVIKHDWSLSRKDVGP